MTVVSMKHLLEAGVHFGHQTRRWNPKMEPYIFTERNGIYIIDLQQTLALIEEGTPVVVICPRDFTFEETLANAAETKARGAYVIGVSEKWHPLFDEWIEIHDVEEIFYPLVTIVPLQLLAYYLAVARGTDPDKPRNLAKSVTVK